MLSIPRFLKFGLIVPMVVIVASLLAFLLNVPVEWMVRRGARRSRARILVFLLALVIATAIGLTLVPLVLGQARQLLTHLPVWINSGQHQLATLHQQLRASHLPLNLEALEFQIGDQLKEELKLLANPLVGFAALTVSTLLDLLLTVIMTFYLIQYGDRIWAGLMGWLPLELLEPFSRSLRQSFHRFFLGQLILSLCLSGALILVFTILRAPFGFLFGLTIGTMALLPLGGTVGIAVVTVLVTLQQAALGMKVQQARLYPPPPPRPGPLTMQRRLLPFLLLGLWGPLAGPPARAATLAACPAAVQTKADRALAELQQRQHKEDEALRQAPSSSYATMNGPVIRELEKRKQQEQLVTKLKGDAARQHHCQLKGSAFGD